MFSIENLTFRYDQSHAPLTVESWQAGQGQQWLLLGPSGSGKTTLLHLLAGLLTPDSGKLVIAGQEPANMPPRERDRFRGRQIGIVFQQPHLLDSLTVRDNLLLAQYLAGVKQQRNKVHGVLEAIGLASMANRYPHQLSQGQAQRAALARAVINGPALLLADEPTANLDDAHCEQALALLQSQAAQYNATLVIATHDQRVKERLENRLELGGAA